MPTPVNAARQCLTADAAQALDDAVSVARRRGHAQTTSLHAVSALLALPSSALREACNRARSVAYSPRLQFKALELSFVVALDRLPSSQSVDQPPISNSLMAAIKRSQAIQRRHPETFYLYQQQQQSSSMPCVKVEVRELILSILDDPVVSRVFGEAGFRSCDIKLAIIRPPPPPLQYSSSRCPPLFLCNLTGIESDPGRRSFSFPFSGSSGVSGFPDEDEICKRIGEVFARKNGRNPLLIGVCANDACRSFTECIEVRKRSLLPSEISGLKIFSIEEELSEFIAKSRSDGSLGLRFQELEQLAESCSSPGVVISYGDLKRFVGDGWLDAAAYVVTQLTRFLELHHGNLWLMGYVESYDIYLKFLMRYPSIEKDWDLQLLPISSLRPSMTGASRPHSLMESFVPFGGFFSTPSDLKGPPNSTYQSTSCCHESNEKYKREVSNTLKGEYTVSVPDQYRANLPSWLQMADLGTVNTLDVEKAKDDGTVLNVEIMRLKRKWNEKCQPLHHTCPMPKNAVSPVGSQELRGNVEFSCFSASKDGASSYGKNTNAPPIRSESENVYCSIGSPSKHNTPIPLVPITKNADFLSKLKLLPSKSDPMFNLNIPDNHASPSSATSVMTDLGLGMPYESTCKELKKPISQSQDRLLEIYDCFPDLGDVVNRNVSNPPAQSFSCRGLDTRKRFDPRNFKELSRALIEMIGRQEAAIYSISQTVAYCRTENGKRRGGSLRGDIWLSFLGPDRVGKKRIAIALAEILSESRENLICVDFSFLDGTIPSNTIFNWKEINDYDVKFRGKTVVDYIAGELIRKPLSVVFLENVDKADLLVQHSLSQAIKTGKFSDSRGREISINNAIFVTTSRFTKGGKTFFNEKKSSIFSEDRIVGAQGLQMQISIGSIPVETSLGNNSNVLITSRKEKSSQNFHKATNILLDLNLPVEEVEENDTDHGSHESDSISENSEAWLEEFCNQVDETVEFKPFDFDSHANTILKEIGESIQKIIGPKAFLVVDIEVMEEILAASWVSEKKMAVEDWVKKVLGRSFVEARERYSLEAQSVLKLVTCEGLLMEEQAPGVSLPSRIILN